MSYAGREQCDLLSVTIALNYAVSRKHRRRVRVKSIFVKQTNLRYVITANFFLSTVSKVTNQLAYY